MDRRDGPAVQFGDVPQVGHVREVPPGDGDRGSLDLAGPQWADTAPRRCQGENADPIEQAPQSNRAHRPTSGHFVQKSGMVLSTSFPHTSQPGGDCRANSSTLGTSPMRATILSRASSGFLLWASMGEMIN